MTIQYQGVWSLQSAAQLQSTQRWVTDPLYKNTTLLLQADDAANGAQNNTFLDSSSNAFAITRNGNTTQGSFTPFSQVSGAWSNFFGGSGNYLKSGTLAAISTTQTTFTVECWVYMTQLPAGSIPVTIGDLAPESNTANWTFGPNSSGKVAFYWFTTVGNTATGSTVLALNTWHHIAVSVSGSAISIYVNGVKETLTGTTTLTNRASIFNSIGMGQRSAGGEIFYGYVSNARIVSGAALYSGNVIAVPNTPLGAASSGTTQLITCQSNRFLDTSSNAVSMTPTGSSMTVQPFSPFAPQYQWTSSVIGGSGYFDGTTDFLNFTGSSATNFNGTDWTIETWVYLNGAPTDYLNIIQSTTGTNNWVPYLAVGFRSTYEILVSLNAVQYQSTQKAVPYAWNHIAVVRSGGVVKVYLNGAATSISVTVDINNSNLSFWIGKTDNTPGGGSFFAYLNGYMCGTRFTKTAVYTGAFTPPTRPLSDSGAASAAAYPSTTNVNTNFAASNTSLLLNFTNAGITDATAKNDLETVGNAQVSTAVVKYGSGSMYFDGSGDYLRSASNPVCALGSGDFTIEFWANIPSYSSNRILSWGTTSAPIIYFASGYLYYDIYGGANIAQSTIITPLNTWTHCAVVRLNGVTKLYINGVQGGSATDTNNWTGQSGFWVGTDAGTTFYTGYLDDLRITKGIARYTQNFIPPSVALPRQ